VALSHLVPESNPDPPIEPHVHQVGGASLGYGDELAVVIFRDNEVTKVTSLLGKPKTWAWTDGTLAIACPYGLAHADVILDRLRAQGVDGAAARTTWSTLLSHESGLGRP
jgi:hypothetical protein